MVNSTKTTLKDIASNFLKSGFFTPEDECFLEIVNYFLSSSTISLSPIDEEIAEREKLLNRTFNRSKELHFLQETIPMVITEAQNQMTGNKLLLNEKSHSLKGSSENSFMTQTFQSCLRSVLHELQSCYKIYEFRFYMQSAELPALLNEYYFAKDKLVNVSDFSLVGDGFVLDKENIVVYPELPYQLMNQLFQLFEQDFIDTRIMIWARHFGSAESHSASKTIMADRLFGMPFTEENLRKVIQKQHGTLSYNFSDAIDQTKASFFYVPLKELQYVIKSSDNNSITLSIEEIIDVDKEDYFTFRQFCYQCGDEFYMLHRFFHAIIDRTTLNISHADMSYMIYDLASYCERVEGHLKDKVVNATLKRKLFRIDGSILFESFKHIMAACFEGNPEIVNFLAGE